MSRFGLFLCLLFLAAVPSGSSLAATIDAKDSDGIDRVLNQPGHVSVVIYSNPTLQNRTRAAGASIDAYQGRPGFRIYVLVDLRGTMADWAAGYTVRRMQRDLNTEAQRVEPFYRKNGNEGNPRKDVSAIADFKGVTCMELGWDKPEDHLRVTVFDREGNKVRGWEDLKDVAELQKTIAGLYPQ